MNSQRLYRSRTNKVFAGVCGGLAEYFDVDPVIIRILFVLMVLFGGSGILLYIAAIIIVPQKPYSAADFTPQGTQAQATATPSNARNILGYILIIGGGLLLLANLEVFHFFDFIGNAIEYIFPILLIILGMAIIYYRQSNPASESSSGDQFSSGGQQSQSQSQSYRQFRRSFTDKKIAGVCGGLAGYFGIDPSIMRMLYVILCLASFGAGLVLYIILALVVPYDYAIKS
ncbi:MAG: PspC domain-containing protein [Ignavibacteriales bacterium]|nr:PspC domain-containing protein [Ignavibacteriales bacterium]